MSVDSRSFRVFLASFLVLFLEVALIRWMPAHVRLLSYFSNFILLASFLGIGIGCLLAPSRVRLFTWFPLLQAVVVAVVYFFKLEVTVPSSGDIFFSSGTPRSRCWSRPRCCCRSCSSSSRRCSPTLAQRMAREMSALPPLRAYTINILGSLAGVVAFAVMSWQELSPTWWFGVGFAAAVPLLVADYERSTGGTPARRRQHRPARGDAGHGPPGCRAARSGRRTTRSPCSTATTETVVEVNNIFHQSMAPVDQKEYFYQWPYMAFGNTFKNVLILGAGSGTDVAAALRHGVEHVDAVEIDPVIIRLGRRYHPDRPVPRSRASPSSTTTRGTSCGRRPRSTTSSSSR